MAQTMLKAFDQPDERREFPHGRFEIVHLDGVRLDLLPGMAFHISSTPHDSWVERDAPYVSLHVLGPARA